jgi:acetyl esterase
MRDEKACKSGKRMQRITKALFRLQRLGKKKIGTVRHIDTAYGAVRVLEYGFENERIAPLYLDLHGGGSVLMDADWDETINVYLQKATGVKIVSIDYPKAPDYPFPVALNAVYEIALHYKNHAAERGIDPTRIGIGGHSVGANFSTSACMMAKDRGDLQFCFQVLDYPPLDLDTDPFAKPLPKKAIPPKMAYMFNACYIDSEQSRNPLVSPVFASPEMLKDLPPALIIVAGQDSLHDEGVLYANMLTDAGVDVELHDFPDAAHGFTLSAGKDSDEALALMAEFIAKQQRERRSQRGA